MGTASTSFTVDVTARDLCALSTRLVSHVGIANSLCVKLDAGSYAAYRNELRAQSGKKVTSADAALLSSLSTSLG